MGLVVYKVKTRGTQAPALLHRPDFSVALILSQTTKILTAPKFNAAKEDKYKFYLTVRFYFLCPRKHSGKREFSYSSMLCKAFLSGWLNTVLCGKGVTCGFSLEPLSK